MLVRAKEAYQLWHGHLVHVKRMDRFTIGERIDGAFLEFLELVFRASFAADKFEKLSHISAAIAKCDIVKFLLQIAWEGKVINSKIYGALILNLDEVGRMLGGWKRTVKNKTPAR